MTQRAEIIDNYDASAKHRPIKAEPECFHCRVTGHYTNTCPQRQVSTSEYEKSDSSLVSDESVVSQKQCFNCNIS